MITFHFYGFYLLGAFKQYGQTQIADDEFLSLAGSVGLLLNGVFRIFWSTLLDHFAFKKVFSILLGIQLLMISVVEISVFYRWFYFVVVVISISCEGAIASIQATITMKFFGPIRGPEVYAF